MKFQRFGFSFTPFSFACFSNSVECFKTLCNHTQMPGFAGSLTSSMLGDKKDQISCLFSAVKNKNSELLRILVNELKMDSGIKDNNGRTAMHEAATHGADLMIYMLAEMGLDTNTPDY